jgi:4-amino-4-deoxy-L-arabinose transferase-like glycosyltransferase
MAGELSRRRGSSIVPGLLIGVLLGLISMVLVAIALALVPLALLVSAKALREVPLDRQRSAGSAGVLVGAGAVFTFGALNTVAACAGTEDFCGNANIVPFLAFALFTLTWGVVVSILTVVRSNR